MNTSYSIEGPGGFRHTCGTSLRSEGAPQLRYTFE